MRSTGRVPGVLVLVQLVGLIVPFILIKPASYSTFLATGAASAMQVRVGVALLLVNALVTLALSLRAFPTFRRSGEAAALGLIALAVMWFAVQAVDNGHLLSMLSLSERAAEAGASTDALQTIAQSLYGTRRFIHYTELLMIDLWFFAFYALLFRSAVVPRGLGAFGMLMAVTHFAAVPLPVLLLGGRSFMPLAPVLAFSHLAVAVWLLVKGFRAAAVEAAGATPATSLVSAG